jgi:enoyl-CoA hydratase/carnithine racemase
MSDRITITVDAGVADVRLNRPHKLNALDLEMFDELAAAGEELKRNPRVRVAVLSGNGRAFCAGLDLELFSLMADSVTDRRQGVGGLARRVEGRITNVAQQAAYVWSELPQPVIAAVHGPALGAGFQIALACDIRVVAPTAQLALREVQWGLIPDMTGTQMLPRLVGLDVAKELTLTGRTVSGTEAKELGLATVLDDNPYEAALELAWDIAAKSPHATRGVKALLNLAGQVPLAAGFLAEEHTILDLIGSPNNIEAVNAARARRPAGFEEVEP